MPAKSLIAPAVITCVVLVATAALAEFVWQPGTSRPDPEPPRGYEWNRNANPQESPPAGHGSPPPEYPRTIRLTGVATRGGSQLPGQAAYRVVWVLDPTKPVYGRWVTFTGKLDVEIETERPCFIEVSSSGLQWNSGPPTWADAISFGTQEVDRDPTRVVTFADYLGIPVKGVTVSAEHWPSEKVRNTEGKRLFPGRYEASMTVGSLNARRKLRTTFTVADTDLEVRFPATPHAIGVVSVTVQDRHGNRMPTTDVRCLRDDGDVDVDWAFEPLERSSTAGDSPTTDVARFENLPFGRYAVVCDDGSINGSKVTVSISASTPEVDVTLNVGGPTVVRLTMTHEGIPLSGAGVKLEDQSAELDAKGFAEFLLPMQKFNLYPQIWVSVGEQTWVGYLTKIRFRADNDVTLRLEDLIEPPGTRRLVFDFVPSKLFPEPSKAGFYVSVQSSGTTWNENRMTCFGVSSQSNAVTVRVHESVGFSVNLPIESQTTDELRWNIDLRGARIKADLSAAALKLRKVEGNRCEVLAISLDGKSEARMPARTIGGKVEEPLPAGVYLVAAVFDSRVLAWQKIEIVDGQDVDIQWTRLELPSHWDRIVREEIESAHQKEAVVEPVEPKRGSKD